jgi:peroxiredoxin
MTQQGESLNRLFAALHAERERTWDPEQLRSNVAQRAHLVSTADRAAFVMRGDTVSPFALLDADGEELPSDALLRDGPLVLVFFRFAGCPACNVALPYYQRSLLPGLTTLGASLVAVTPQVPARAQEIRTRHGLGFRVATDPDNRLAHRFGIVFEPDPPTRQAALARGSFIGDVTGTGTWELPMPSVVVVDQDRVVRFAQVSPDWMNRSEAAPILEAVRSTRGAEAA